MAPNECCRDESNLEIIQNDAHVKVKRCRVCKCRHFKAFMVRDNPDFVAPAVKISGTDTK